MLTTLNRAFPKSNTIQDVTPRPLNFVSGGDGNYLTVNGTASLYYSAGLSIEGMDFKKGGTCLQINCDEDYKNAIVIQQEHYEWVPVYSRKLF